MKILILAPGNSPHTIKWVNGITTQNHNVILYSLTRFDTSLYKDSQYLSLYSLGMPEKIGLTNSINKIRYLSAIPQIKQLIKKHAPDILHAHYLSSYGFIGAILNFSPYIISVWGTDIFDFPKHSFINKAITKYALKRASIILSTSHIMKDEIKKYTSKDIQVIPFGIDCEKFVPNKQNKIEPDDELIIGTVKGLKEVYGISYLIRAFSLLVHDYKIKNVKLKIYGQGPEKENYIKLANDLIISEYIDFLGYITPEKVPNILTTFDIFAAVSLRESFGVAVIEASACGIPVVVSNVGGLPEVVIDGITGIIVPKENPVETAKALYKLITNSQLRVILGREGRKFVINSYNFSNNLTDLIKIYESVLIGNIH